ncbi:MAG: class I SAM-dependent methyltransferase [Paraglaciecola sp.]|uniref:class I SAM-dependent methyltransferase n=1 Tax=Paraglaciecola sp. TaxID=1920173 RepID=UPI00329985F2
MSQKQNVITLNNEQGALVLSEPWQLEIDKNSLNELLVDNVLQTMTSMEADYALLKWFSALKVEGELTINVPNADFYARMWLDSTWSEKTLRDNESKARQSFSHLWGAQQTGNPRNDNYDEQHHGVFKSAYNKKRLTFLLERAGFVVHDVQEIDNGQLIAHAKKSMDKGERQVATDYKNIRDDHKNRYQFACDQLVQTKPSKILDLACGVGYGTLMLAKATEATVTGVDIERNAIEHANKYFSNNQTKFICEDAKKCNFPLNSFDAIISFETIEHVAFDQELLTIFNRALKPGGCFICSTPNEDVMPFDPKKFRFHEKHYTNSELLSLLNDTGFVDVELFTQHDPGFGTVVVGTDGCFTIAKAIKL